MITSSELFFGVNVKELVECLNHVLNEYSDKDKKACDGNVWLRPKDHKLKWSAYPTNFRQAPAVHIEFDPLGDNEARDELLHYTPYSPVEKMLKTELEKYGYMISHCSWIKARHVLIIQLYPAHDITYWDGYDFNNEEI